MPEPDPAGLSRLALGISNCRPADRVVEAIVAAERLGVRAAFIAEDVGCRDAFQLAALVAGATSRIRLTVGVATPYLRSPDVLARAAATLEEIAPGRFTLGLGSSSRDIIEGQLGIDYDRPLVVMHSAILAMRGELSKVGARPRVILAAMGPRMLRLAGEVADGVLLNTGTTPDYVRWARARVAEGCHRAGRDRLPLGLAVWIPAYTGDDLKAAFGRAGRWAATMLSVPDQGELLLEHAGLDGGFLPELRTVCRAYPVRGDVDRGAALVPESVVRRLALIGSPDEIGARLAEYFAAGVDTAILAPGPLRALTSILNPEAVPRWDDHADPSAGGRRTLDG